MDKVLPLENLAELFSTKNVSLYIVGGYVRDKIVRKLEDEVTDIDLTSPLLAEEVKELLKGSDYKVMSASKKLGTVIIKHKNVSYEYTTFRKDSYPDSGVHTPSSVEFIKDINQDALRRDFRCNAIYYDIKNKKIVDPLDGTKDVEKKILRTTRPASEVFAEDGLRLLRLFRFCATLGFSIERETFYAAKEESFRIKDIAKERIIVELDKLLKGDYALLGLYGLRDSGLLKEILPDLALGENMIQNQKYHTYDVLEHSFRACVACPKHLRLAGLLHDIGKPYCFINFGKFYGHENYGATLAENWMKEYKYSNKEISLVKDMVRYHMFDFNGMAKETTVRKFIFNHFDILEDLMCVMTADAIATGKTDSSMPATAIKEQLKKLKKHNIPIRLKDLGVDGNDMISLGYQKEEIKEVLGKLQELEYTTLNHKSREQLLEYAKGWRKGKGKCKKKC